MKSIFGVIIGVLFVVFFVMGAMFDEFIHKIKFGNQTSQNDPVEVSSIIKVQTSVSPSIFVARPNFYASNELKNKAELSADEKAQIGATFANITELAAKSGLCTGGAYRVYPVRGANDQITQRLNASLECKITRERLNEYSNLIGEIDKILDEDKFVRADLAGFEQIISEEDAQKAKAKLSSKLFEKITANAKELSKNLNLTCKPSKISYSPNTWNFARTGAKIANANGVASLPIAKDEKQTMSADVSYICK